MKINVGHNKSFLTIMSSDCSGSIDYSVCNASNVYYPFSNLVINNEIRFIFIERALRATFVLFYIT